MTVNNINYTTLQRLDNKTNKQKARIVKLEVTMGQVVVLLRVIAAIATANLFLSDPIVAVAKAASAAVTK
jgi:hypothetical protein